MTKACPTLPVSPGQTLTFSGSVSNTGNVVQGNRIGTDAQGLRALANGSNGVEVAVGAHPTIVGGTALAVVAELHRRGALQGVVASETRPLLQGARLTAWELRQLGVPFRLAVDSAGPFLMARGEVDAVIVGADRICANGDVVNKVGTYAHALGAARAGIPFLVVAPESTVDTATAEGAAVPIEDRGRDEVLHFHGARTAPDGVDAVNPAFDVTPHDLVTAIVTDQRVIRLDKGDALA